MRYIISDIHGCKNEYLRLLDQIHFSDEDHLYVLGDAVDRGIDPIGVLKDMMKHKNLTFILGNHEYFFLYMIKLLGLDMMNFQDESDKEDFRLWIKDGGLSTLEGFLKLPETECWEIFDYISNAKAFETLEYDGKTYILVHAGISGFDEKKLLEDYNCVDFLCERMDYSKRYYSDDHTYLISGHTPTPYVRPDGQAEVFMDNGHIAIDCGCVYGGKLAAYCIETGLVEYVLSE